VPDFLAALEGKDLKEPGTVALLNLKYGDGLEAPSRVILGAWPPEREKTRWDVLPLDMKLARTGDPGNPGDSAVTMYWDEKEIGPKQTRTVGFSYGLGSISVDTKEGQLGLLAGGETAAGKEFTLTAYAVKSSTSDTEVTLSLPRGMKLVGGAETQKVPPRDVASPYSPVFWRVTAKTPGIYQVKATLSSGGTLEHRVVVR
jgi:hypothetical protein